MCVCNSGWKSCPYEHFGNLGYKCSVLRHRIGDSTKNIGVRSHFWACLTPWSGFRSDGCLQQVWWDERDCKVLRKSHTELLMGDVREKDVSRFSQCSWAWTVRGWEHQPRLERRWLWQGIWLMEASDGLPVPRRKSSLFGKGTLSVWFFCLVLWWYSMLHLGGRVVTWEGPCCTTTVTLQMLDLYRCFPIWLQNFLSDWCSAPKSAKICWSQIRAVSPVSSSEIR